MRTNIKKKIPGTNYQGCEPLSNFELVRKLGEGTFGVVHLAKHRITGKEVALKKILVHNEKDGFPITAMREISILSSLNHDNVLTISSLVYSNEKTKEEDKCEIYMALPFMHHDLSGLLNNPKVKFTGPQIKCYMKQIFEGMAFLHHNNIMHRDIKPANLLINDEGSILKVADFGLARPLLIPKHNMYTQSVVTRWYRPLELLFKSQYYSEAIDMWGVGCVFGQLLTGKPLIPGMTDIEQIDLIFQLMGTPDDQEWPEWRKLPGVDQLESIPNYPRSLEERFSNLDRNTLDLLQKLLTYNPAERITAAQALEHPYFHTLPYPSEPGLLPKYPCSHEFVQLKENAKAARPPPHMGGINMNPAVKRPGDPGLYNPRNNGNGNGNGNGYPRNKREAWEENRSRGNHESNWGNDNRAPQRDRRHDPNRNRNRNPNRNGNNYDSRRRNDGNNHRYHHDR
ncbi:Pkinase-domain-containing protein [Neoconidiobolus thromboides FSU 785]|nr:Pkinase-domain-containing protein [Neoconidiobolus thromboides FSU 785]